MSWRGVVVDWHETPLLARLWWWWCEFTLAPVFHVRFPSGALSEPMPYWRAARLVEWTGGTVFLPLGRRGRS